MLLPRNFDPTTAWIRANVWMSLTTLLFDVANSLLAQRLISVSPEWKQSIIGLDVITTVIVCFVYARSTSSVLDRLLPSFPRRSWLGLHLCVGTAIGAVLGYYRLNLGERLPPEEPLEVFLMMLVTACFTMGVCAAMQAMVLRKCARGTYRYVGFTALSGMALVGPMMIEAMSTHDLDNIGLVIVGLATTIAFTVVAIVQVTALLRLTPR